MYTYISDIYRYIHMYMYIYLCIYIYMCIYIYLHMNTLYAHKFMKCEYK